MDASVYLLICLTVCKWVLFSLLPRVTPMEAKEGNTLWRKYVINKTLPPKELSQEKNQVRLY